MDLLCPSATLKELGSLAWDPALSSNYIPVLLGQPNSRLKREFLKM
jgi:hypothetical protein